MSLLELKNVHTYYGHIHALKGISLTVEEGEIVTLIGSNGAGKTTTLRTISGLVKPRQGEVLFQGRPIHRLPAHEIVALGVGHVPEGRRIFPRLTVEENLEIGAGLPALSPALRAPPAEGGNAFGRRAADARHRPGPDAKPEDPPHGRALHGPRPRSGGLHL